MAQCDVYLSFPGNAEEVFTFYKSVLGGEFTSLMRFKDAPQEENMPSSQAEKIMHVSLPIGNKGNFLMASDCMDPSGDPLVVGNNFSISLTTDTREQADVWYAGLAMGGKSTMPMADVFWGDYFGTLTDKFGVQWMISFNEAFNAKQG